MSRKLSDNLVQRRSTRIILVLVLLLSSSWTLAQQGTELPAPGTAQGELNESEEEAAPGPVNQQEALERVRARFDGDIISITEVETGEGLIRFRVRMDNQGNIFTVFVDPATGRVSRE